MNEMQNTTLVDCATTINEISHKSHVTIDWSGMTPADLQAIAEGRIVIKFQDEHRRKGQVPPENVTLKATDFRVGVRRRMTAEDAVRLLTPEQLKAILREKGLA